MFRCQGQNDLDTLWGIQSAAATAENGLATTFVALLASLIALQSQFIYELLLFIVEGFPFASGKYGCKLQHFVLTLIVFIEHDARMSLSRRVGLSFSTSKGEAAGGMFTGAVLFDIAPDVAYVHSESHVEATYV